MERIRFHVFFKISLIGCSGLLSFSPNKEKKKENSPRYKACRQRHEIVPNTILMPQIIGNFRSV